jgi:hypothetical protein
MVPGYAVRVAELFHGRLHSARFFLIGAISKIAL